MPSRRIQFTLNSQKTKERVILDLLSTFYDESIGIKEVLYKYALSQNVQIEKSEQKEQITQSVQSEHKVQNERIEQNEQSEDDDISVDLSEFSDEAVEVKAEGESKSQEIKQKKLKALKQFI